MVRNSQLLHYAARFVIRCQHHSRMKLARARSPARNCTSGLRYSSGQRGLRGVRVALHPDSRLPPTRRLIIFQGNEPPQLLVVLFLWHTVISSKVSLFLCSRDRLEELKASTQRNDPVQLCARLLDLDCGAVGGKSSCLSWKSFHAA